MDDLPCYGVNMTAVLEADREAATTSEETMLRTSSTDDVNPDQNGGRRISPAFFVLEGGVSVGVVGAFALCAIVLRVVTAGGWH